MSWGEMGCRGDDNETISGYANMMVRDQLVFLTITQLPRGYRKYETINIDEWREHLALQPTEGEG